MNSDCEHCWKKKNLYIYNVALLTHWEPRIPGNTNRLAPPMDFFPSPLLWFAQSADDMEENPSPLSFHFCVNSTALHSN